MPTVFDLLEEVRKRPELFVGMTSGHRGAQLRRMELLLSGYDLAVQRHGIEDPGKYFLRSFEQYIQKHLGWTDSGIGIIAAIQMHTASDKEAWELFWNLLDDFRRSAA
jgi:hypothetical protein